MRTFNNLDTEKKRRIILEARAWFNDHYAFVKRIVDLKTIPAVPDIDICLLGPGMWKAGHWAWFLDNMDTLGDINAS